MNVELDEVYIASLKEMFKEFDDEIIWSAVFEHGFEENGDYKLENVVNYLLELSNEKINYEEKKIIIPDTNIEQSSIKNINSSNSDNDNDFLLEIDNEFEEAEEIDSNLFTNLINLVTNNEGYQKIKNSE